MENKIKMIIFDWARTLYDVENNTLFNGVIQLIEDLSKKYRLALVSLSKSEHPNERKRKIEESGIGKYFDIILAGAGNKDDMYDEVLANFDIPKEEIMVIDDRTIRGVAWGNGKGIDTVWLKSGKFSHELPTEKTGNPTYVITDLSEIRSLLL